jgi:hypothetical protein
MKDTQERIRVLEDRHQLLDEKIRVLFKRYATDAEVEELKLKKLHIKDEIVRLQKELDNA